MDHYIFLLAQTDALTETALTILKTSPLAAVLLYCLKVVWEKYQNTLSQLHELIEKTIKTSEKLNTILNSLVDESGDTNERVRALREEIIRQLEDFRKSIESLNKHED